VGPKTDAQGSNEGPHSWDAAIGAVAGRQHGVISLAQCLELGLTRRAIRVRLEARRLVKLHRGVFAVGHEALTSRSRDLAAVLACGPGALLSHRSAAHSWQLLRSSSARIDVTASRGCKPKPGITVHRSRLIHPDDRASVDGIPTTSVARTLVDLAEDTSERLLADAVSEAEVRRLFDLRAMEATLERLPGRRGRHRLRRVMAAYRPDPNFTRSRAERRFLDMCAEHGLPKPSTCLWIAGHEVDAYWPDARLDIEFDGEAFHHTTRAFHEDRRRDRQLGTFGIQVNRVTWRDLQDPARLVADLQSIRKQRLQRQPAA
jgi:very-short-patch-repair endonuclease